MARPHVGRPVVDKRRYGGWDYERMRIAGLLRAIQTKMALHCCSTKYCLHQRRFTERQTHHLLSEHMISYHYRKFSVVLTLCGIQDRRAVSSFRLHLAAVAHHLLCIPRRILSRASTLALSAASRWPEMPHQQYDENTERVSHMRRLPEDDR